MSRLALSFLVVAACPLLAQEKPPPPQLPALTPGTINVMGDAVNCDAVHTGYKNAVEYRTVVRQGMTVTEVVTKQVPYSIVQRIVLDPRTLRAYRSGAKSDDPTKTLEPIEAAALTPLLKSTRQVMLARGEKPKPEQLKDIKPGTVILVLPKLPEAPKAPEKK
jgi:hypothetical protein